PPGPPPLPLNPRPPSPPPGNPPRPPPPPPWPWPPRWPCPAPTSLPNPIVLLRRRFMVNSVGPVPMLIGITFCPGAGIRLKVPNCVHAKFDEICTALQLVVEASDGRSLKIESPFRS